MKLRSALLTTAMVALPLAAASAQAVDGLYVGAGLGANFIQRESFKTAFPTPGGTQSGDMRSNVGFAGVMSIGWGFGNGFRAEIEGDYRGNSGFNDPEGFGRPGTGGGTEQKAGGMVNALYDFVGVVPMVQPYVGVGAGYMADIEQNLHVPVGATGAFASTRSKGSFAYQAILGAAYPVSPAFAITMEYRFMGLAGERSYPATMGAASGTIKSTNDYNHAVLIGFRYAFNTPTVAVQQMQVAQDIGAKTFLVFFDWDKADLTSRSQGIVRDAATYSTHQSYTRIDVDGNADTSGTPTYNQGLSERRAHVVAAELVRDGVPQSAISMHAYGDTKLLVPTGPNTREPQNRRVEIVFH